MSKVSSQQPFRTRIAVATIFATVEQAASDVRSGIRGAKRGAINALRAEGLSIVVWGAFA